MSKTIEMNLGRVTGKSAYEVAVKNGFEGTESDWLKSLRGPKGDSGNGNVIGLTMPISISVEFSYKSGY